MRPPGGGWTGAIALRFIVPLRAPYASRHDGPMAQVGKAAGVSQRFVSPHRALSRVGLPFRSLRCDTRERTTHPHKSLKGQIIQPTPRPEGFIHMRLTFIFLQTITPPHAPQSRPCREQDLRAGSARECCNPRHSVAGRGLAECLPAHPAVCRA